MILVFIGKLGISPLMCAADKVWITELTLIHKNIRSVRNSHAQELTLILKIIGQCDVKHILMSLIKTITSVLKISAYIITSITLRPIGLVAILVIMSFSSFKTAIILYLIQCGKKLIHKQPLLATIAQHKPPLLATIAQHKQPLLATIAQHKQPLLATITQHNWATIKVKLQKKN
jgi:hypothetical protein